VPLPGFETTSYAEDAVQRAAVDRFLARTPGVPAIYPTTPGVPATYPRAQSVSLGAPQTGTQNGPGTNVVVNVNEEKRGWLGCNLWPFSACCKARPRIVQDALIAPEEEPPATFTGTAAGAPPQSVGGTTMHTPGFTGTGP
jgi:hypothetical protein